MARKIRPVVLQLVPQRPSRDTIEVLEDALERARAGEVLGVAIALLERGGAYSLDAAGACRRDPTRARGMVAALDDALAGLLQA